MAQIIEVETFAGKVSVYVNDTRQMIGVCSILNSKKYSYFVGSGFSTKIVSIDAIGIAKDFGFDLTNKEGIKKAFSNTYVYEEYYKKNREIINEKNTKLIEKNEPWRRIIVTTADLKDDYEVIGPVYFQISNKGIFSSTLSRLKTLYTEEIKSLKQKGMTSPQSSDWGALYGEFSVGQNDFDIAFYISVQELKKRASLLGADAIVGMRQDIDLDTTNIAHFYLEMYGTAVKYIIPDIEENNEVSEEPKV